jgi:hypothetical protein
MSKELITSGKGAECVRAHKSFKRARNRSHIELERKLKTMSGRLFIQNSEFIIAIDGVRTTWQK